MEKIEYGEPYQGIEDVTISDGEVFAIERSCSAITLER